MSACNYRFLWLVALISCSPAAFAGGGYVLGIGAAADDSDGRSLTGFVDYGFTDRTWLSAAVATTSTDAVVGGLDTTYGDVGLEHSFGLAGIRVGAAYWGNDEILDSEDIRAAFFFRGKQGSLSFNYERRDFDFVFSPILQPDEIRTAEFSADGIGAAASLMAGNSVRLFINGMRYDYSQNIRLQPRIDSLVLLSSTRLSLINSIIDHRLSGGIEFRLGKRLLDFSLSSWQTAIDGAGVNSIAVGFVTPMSPASDFEIRLAFDQSDNFGDAVSLAITLYFFGG